MADEAPLEQRFAAASTEFARTTIRTKEDAQKLHGRVNDWREDVNTLAGQIAAQLNVCKSLRTSKAMHSIAATPTPLDVVRFGDVDPFHLMRSDIRSLYDFRLSTLRSQIVDASNTTSIDLELDKDASVQAQLKLILDEPSTVEKAGDADTAFQSMLKRKATCVAKLPTIYSGRSARRTSNAAYMKVVELCSSLLRSRPKHGSRKTEAPRSPTAPSAVHQLFAATSASPPDNEASKVTSTRLDEANFTIQKLHREISELKIANAKLAAANSQLDDSYAHVLSRFEAEKDAHQASIGLHEPRIRKLEEEIQASAKALSELRLNVDLITSMYKVHISKKQTNPQRIAQKTCDEVVEFDRNRILIQAERDAMAKKLHDEIKKLAVVNLEIVRKDKLTMYAMGARHEALQALKETQRQLHEMTMVRDGCNQTIAHLGETVDKLNASLRETTSGQTDALAAQEQMLLELRATIDEQATAHAATLQQAAARHDEEYTKLQAKLDKTNKELVESVQDNIISFSRNHALDGKLRQAQERISRFLSA
ncbi:hypothetical protein SPRG_16551 [Saprolegnia parasitica CBS 223.65]|uniref:Uncharacterized protein n=1 Tax=Saprolegnia parasitica (strain CBS 223.65) TaxID=695850 RepID=A0A067BI16_SAPPC|nr:hypothetical protein SPRG_16551 [Saprolegnia parasitica CBS 223.65]KDO18039.1 hypothetical protein SPRG_16551 [Saprolegnia parasitica CBS 223.65]|eukprot:XP_012211256.1 hypothetical protein SPRG_16551 [Saprolegnia parasitica CBS 223.65]